MHPRMIVVCAVVAPVPASTPAPFADVRVILQRLTGTDGAPGALAEISDGPGRTVLTSGLPDYVDYISEQSIMADPLTDFSPQDLAHTVWAWRASRCRAAAGSGDTTAASSASRRSAARRPTAGRRP